jgi:hemerythrin superfamily protein
VSQTTTRGATTRERSRETAQTKRGTRPEHDVVELLRQQHEEIRQLFRDVESRRGEARRESFQQLVRMLAVHETAEEMVVHPRSRTTVPGGDAIVDARLKEEHEAKELLADLDRIGPDGAGFDSGLAELRDAVLRHAEQEEREEFPGLRRNNTEAQLRGMATLVRAAEMIAPTHPHPGVESATANMIAGPVASVTDRVRDAIRASRERAEEEIEARTDR